MPDVKSATILVGFTEGEWHGKKMRRLLRQRGIKITTSVAEADYVIAHSAGCFDIPHLKQSQTLLLINPPYWPEKPLPTRGFNMIKQLIVAVRPGNQPFYHLHKTSYNFGYLIRHQQTNREMIKRSRTFNLEQEIKHSKAILVRNSNDPWLTPHLDGLQTINPHLTVKHLSGDHDDCWVNPEPYIDLLLSYGATLKS